MPRPNTRTRLGARMSTRRLSGLESQAPWPVALSLKLLRRRFPSLHQLLGHPARKPVHIRAAGATAASRMGVVDPGDAEDGDHRFLVDEKHSGYVTVASGTFTKGDHSFAPIPSFPSCYLSPVPSEPRAMSPGFSSIRSPRSSPVL